MARKAMLMVIGTGVILDQLYYQARDCDRERACALVGCTPRGPPTRARR